MSIAHSKLLHCYLGLQGEFKTRLPQEIVFPNMDAGRMDECYLTDRGMLVDLEEESEEISPKSLSKFAKYGIFLNYWHYPADIHIGVICHKNPKKDFECYKHNSSCSIKVHYYYISQDKLWVKYEKLIKKVKQKEELTEMEAMDICFISKFISNKHSLEVIKALSYVFRDALIADGVLRRDVGVVLAAMVLKRVGDSKIQERLLMVIGMKKFDNEIQRLVYDEFGEELDLKDQEIESKDQEIESKNKEIGNLTKTNDEYRMKVKELNDEIGDSCSPKVKEILQSLLLL